MNSKKNGNQSSTRVYTIEDDNEFLYDIGIEFSKETKCYTVNIMQFDKNSGKLIHSCDMTINKNALNHLITHLTKALLYP